MPSTTLYPGCQCCAASGAPNYCASGGIPNCTAGTVRFPNPPGAGGCYLIGADTGGSGTFHLVRLSVDTSPAYCQLNVFTNNAGVSAAYTRLLQVYRHSECGVPGAQPVFQKTQQVNCVNPGTIANGAFDRVCLQFLQSGAVYDVLWTTQDYAGPACTFGPVNSGCAYSAELTNYDAGANYETGACPAFTVISG